MTDNLATSQYLRLRREQCRMRSRSQHFINGLLTTIISASLKANKDSLRLNAPRHYQIHQRRVYAEEWFLFNQSVRFHSSSPSGYSPHGKKCHCTDWLSLCNFFLFTVLRVFSRAFADIPVITGCLTRIYFWNLVSRFEHGCRSKEIETCFFSTDFFFS